ncbi:MAG: hypothetical protein JEY97_04085 [Bacteroidales bacterium]|nr:hypothetical protein [Bacteroidales bacterium]
MKKPIEINLLPEAEEFIEKLEFSTRKNYSLRLGRPNQWFLANGLRK